MPSPPRARFQLPGQLPSAPSPSLSPSSTSSTRSLSSLSSRTQRGEEPLPLFQLHPLLQTSQIPIADHIMSFILWDFREDPLEAAQYVKQLGTRLSPETLAEYATQPPIPILRVVCEFPERWEVVVVPSPVRSHSVGGARTRHTFPIYQPSPLPHTRTSSASAPSTLRIDIPPTPVMRTVPLPSSTPSPLSLFEPAPNSIFPTITMPAQPRPQAQSQTQPSRAGVTIADVLTTIFHHLDQSIHTTKYEALPDKQRKRVEAAYDNRTVLSPASPTPTTFPVGFVPVSIVPSRSSAITGSTSTPSALSPGEPIAGMKKVDLLLKNTWFAGLSVATDEGNTVWLSLKSPTPN